MRLPGLSEEGGTLLLQSRFPTKTEDGELQVEASLFNLEPAGSPTESAYDDFRSVLTQAIQHCVRSTEFLVIEVGGWDAPTEPFCFFIVVDDDGNSVNVIETAPPPTESDVWEPHVVPGQESTTLSAPTIRETIDVAPMIMIDAIARWGMQPWDLAFTFGRR